MKFKHLHAFLFIASFQLDESILESVGKRKLEECCDGDDSSKQTTFKLLKSDLQLEADQLTNHLRDKLMKERLKMDKFEQRLLKAADDQTSLFEATETNIENDEMILKAPNNEGFENSSIEEKLTRIQDMLEDSRRRNSYFEKSLNLSLES